MIITDPLKRPSERIAEVIKDYFIERGYKYSKSSYQFSKTIGKRKEMVFLFFSKTVNLVSVSLSWALLFPELEKIYKKVQIREESYYLQTTLFDDFANYLPIRNTGIVTSFDLYNKESYKYDDFSINDAAENLKHIFEQHVKPFLDTYGNLKSLEAKLNTYPLEPFPSLGYGGRRIAFGLTLRKLFDENDYDPLIEIYKKYTANGNEDKSFKRDMDIFIESTTSYLSNVDIKKLITL